MKPWFLILLICSLPAAAQEFPRDTSFTVYSAWQKIKNDFPLAAPVKPFVSPGFLTFAEQVYKTDGNRTLHLDIFVPANKKRHLYPAVLLIHGGGWRSGDKSQAVPMAQKLAMEGFTGVAAEYRLSPEALYPTGIFDLKEAIKFLKARASDFKIDTSKMAVLGCSSGATMATFLGTTGLFTKFDGPSDFPGISAKVQAIVNIDGIVDFTDPAESGKDNNPAKPSAGALWFGGTFKEIPEKWIEASPVNYAGKTTPPILFINSALPRYHAGRDTLLAEIGRFGIYSEVHTIKNTPHPFWLFYPWFDETTGYVVKFLKEVFR